MSAPPAKSYLICATPRTGSTLLCALLKSGGAAGKPESYFRRQDKENWALKWNILGPGKTYEFSDYLNAAIAAGSTVNNIFAARIMWGTMGELVHDLAKMRPAKAGGDLDLLTRAFGPVQFIYLKRRDFVAQAVSLLRAEQTDLWHISDDLPAGTPAATPHYDGRRIHELVTEAQEHNAAWEDWFQRNGIRPYRVMYEDFSADPVKTTREVHDFLGIALEKDIQLKAGNKRLSDQLNEEWIGRYHAEAGENA